jgi:2'-5' RNA ligase
MAFRAFISMDIGKLDGLVALIGDLDGARADIKTVDPEIVHVTLKFLGDVQEDLVPGIVTCMRAAAQGQSPFKVKLRRVGAFPSPSKARVVWVGMEGAEPMKVMAVKLEDSLAFLGFPKEQRGFSPHVTVGRMKGPRGLASIHQLILANQDGEFGEVEFRSIRLKKSVLGPKGPSYCTVEEVKLEG